MKSKNSKANTWHPYQGPIKRDFNPRWQGHESRQVLRRELRAQHGSEPGNKVYRDMMGLPEPRRVTA